MEGNFRTNKSYRETRDAFLLENEGFRTTAYFDTVGIPTVATGVAFLARKKKSKKDKKRGRHFAIHDENMSAINKVLSTNMQANEAMDKFAKDALKAIDYTDEPDYNGGKKTSKAFQSSSRGKKLVKLLGPLNTRWESTRSPKVSEAEAQSISSEVINNHEVILERYLKKIGIDSNKLTEEQRIVLVDSVYHGRWSSGGKKAAEAIKAGKSIDEICQCLYDPKFPGRTKKVALLLKKQWKPSKSNKNITPSRSVKEPGISPEQLSILREYLLAQALSQPIGCTAYEQFFGRFMGAGSDGPWKNPCDAQSGFSGQLIRLPLDTESGL